MKWWPTKDSWYPGHYGFSQPLAHFDRLVNVLIKDKLCAATLEFLPTATKQERITLQMIKLQAP